MGACIYTNIKQNFFSWEALRSNHNPSFPMIGIAEGRKQLLPLSGNVSCHSTSCMFISTSDGAMELIAFLPLLVSTIEQLVLRYFFPYCLMPLMLPKISVEGIEMTLFLLLSQKMPSLNTVHSQHHNFTDAHSVPVLFCT